MIRAKDASLVYVDHGRDVHACRSIEVEIRDGEFVGILGPSGSGKSSLLYLLSGLKMPTSGEVMYRGESMASMPDEKRAKLRLSEFGFVFQQPYLLGYLSALENVLLGDGPNGELEEAHALLKALGIAEKAHRRPYELSGGEKQRVCVARALMGSPRAVFADEPTASLDHTNGVQVVELLNAHRGNGALVMVTHDESMLEGADRVLRIAEGRIE